jgi:hypothetical protein
MRRRQFVKVGNTYSEDPGTRTTGLQKPKPSRTMECEAIPVIGTEQIVYIPGEEAIEKALHERWDADRIDPGREFFWTNKEIKELWDLYRN